MSEDKVRTVSRGTLSSGSNESDEAEDLHG